MSTTSDHQEREKVLSQVIPEVISTRENAEMMFTCPHKKVSGTDLAVVARLQTTDGRSELVTHETQDKFHLTESEIIRAAMQNMRGQEYKMAPLYEMIGAPEEQGAPELLVVSNSSGIYGAAEILNPDVQKEASKRLGGDFYVLPSSIHECILISRKDGDQIGIDSLNAMVTEINATELAKEDKLSDAVYTYDFAAKKIGMPSGEEWNRTETVSQSRSNGRRM